jgi:hypothetical protein
VVVTGDRPGRGRRCPGPHDLRVCRLMGKTEQIVYFVNIPDESATVRAEPSQVARGPELRSSRETAEIGGARNAATGQQSGRSDRLRPRAPPNSPRRRCRPRGAGPRTLRHDILALPRFRYGWRTPVGRVEARQLGLPGAAGGLVLAVPGRDQDPVATPSRIRQQYQIRGRARMFRRGMAEGGEGTQWHLGIWMRWRRRWPRRGSPAARAAAGSPTSTGPRDPQEWRSGERRSNCSPCDQRGAPHASPRHAGPPAPEIRVAHSSPDDGAVLSGAEPVRGWTRRARCRRVFGPPAEPDSGCATGITSAEASPRAGEARSSPVRQRRRLPPQPPRRLPGARGPRAGAARRHGRAPGSAGQW